MFKRYLLACTIAAIVLFAILPLPAFASYAQTIKPTQLIVASINSEEREETYVGQNLVALLRMENLLNEDKDFAVIIEVRDSSGITETLDWQTGKIDARGMQSGGISWIPQKADDYQIRAFVWSGIDNPEPYSTVVQSEITVIRL